MRVFSICFLKSQYYLLYCFLMLSWLKFSFSFFLRNNLTWWTQIQGLEKCTYLTEINLNSNDLRDFNEIRPLLRLPYLKRLDLSNNYFTSKAIKNLRKIARSDNPNLEIIVNSGEANASNNGAARSGSSSNNDVSEGGSCCLMQ